MFPRSKQQNRFGLVFDFIYQFVLCIAFVLWLYFLLHYIFLPKNIVSSTSKAEVLVDMPVTPKSNNIVSESTIRPKPNVIYNSYVNNNNNNNNKISSNNNLRSISSPSESYETVLVVLGNEPLDDNTPTVDTMKRVQLAAEYQKAHPASLIIFTGGPTAGKTTEAQMMSSYAKSLGVPENKIKLEEKARSTEANARLVANILIEQHITPKEIFIVSKNDHLNWAMEIFTNDKIPGKVFKNAKPLGIDVKSSESIEQMENYLKSHESKRVKFRLGLLQKGIKGID